jgi:hypothetical protein
MYDLPSYVWALVLIGAIGIPATTSLMLYRGALAAGLTRRTATTVTATAAAGLGGWILASGLLARAGTYHQEAGHFRPWIGLAFAGYLTALLAATRLPANLVCDLSSAAWRGPVRHRAGHGGRLPPFRRLGGVLSAAAAPASAHTHQTRVDQPVGGMSTRRGAGRSTPWPGQGPCCGACQASWCWTPGQIRSTTAA